MSYFTLFSVVVVCCLLLCIPETVSFTVSFPVAIVEGDCQLVHSMKGSEFSLFLVHYQVLKAIWQPLIETIVED